MKTHKWFFKTNWSIWMNTRSVAAEYRLAHWAKVIQELSILLGGSKVELKLRRKEVSERRVT